MAKKAKEAGVSLVSYDTPFSDSKIPYIGIDHKKVGYELGILLGESLHGTGEVAVIAGSMKQKNHQLRLEGFLDAMKQYENITVATVKTGYSNLQVSEQELQKLKEQFPAMNGIMTTSAVTAMGIVEAMAGEEIKIVSVDAQEDARKAVADGKIEALAAQSGYEIGYETIQYLVNEHEGKVQEKQKILQTDIITRETKEFPFKK